MLEWSIVSRGMQAGTSSLLIKNFNTTSRTDGPRVATVVVFATFLLPCLAEVLYRTVRDEGGLWLWPVKLAGQGTTMDIAYIIKKV